MELKIEPFPKRKFDRANRIKEKSYSLIYNLGYNNIDNPPRS